MTLDALPRMHAPGCKRHKPDGVLTAPLQVIYTAGTGNTAGGPCRNVAGNIYPQGPRSSLSGAAPITHQYLTGRGPVTNGTEAPCRDHAGMVPHCFKRHVERVALWRTALVCLSAGSSNQAWARRPPSPTRPHIITVEASSLGVRTYSPFRLGLTSICRPGRSRWES
ncbi:hypothetical protein GWK47_034240 [Chionoecetes opilio]|uniref:Uncharacterized protein n=1 Tax=Chionoecetes opilio TaxID=41210 RepID=A0A8J4YUY6_CHIOP|nr:hypothetical protein GWK47_034240 [Chionoecetes opilio]